MELNTVERAQAIAQSGAPELVAVEASRILDALVAASNSGKLNDRDAAVGVAVIASLRRILHSMDRAIRRGIVAGEQLTEKQRG